jgi:glycosyltransferase involved in cell wall biosynthesis
VTTVSVVTPFYNSAPYLGECIESVLAQTWGDFEYVLLDNCSSDESGAIAERYARRDPRIRLLRNERLLPQVPNYNRALTLLSSESRYFKMVQADDTIYPRCLEEMVGFADAHPSVALVGSYFHKGRVEPADMPHTAQVLPGREACRRQLLDGVFLFGSPTTLLMRADVVRARSPFYAEGRLYEDTEVCFEILRHHDFGFVPQLLSFTRIDPDSIMGSTSTYQAHLLDRLIRFRLYGRELLTEDEYRFHATEHERQYRRMLAEAWLLRREPEFWEFHRRGLATIGEEIHRARLARDAFSVVVRHALAPAKLGAALRRGRGRS